MTQTDLNRYVTEYLNKKERVDAAYVVFRQEPTAANSNRHMTAVHDLDIYCNRVLAKLAAEVTNTTTPGKMEILANFDKYKTCKTCGKELLYSINESNYVATGDFLEHFQGICYSCLSNYCVQHDCLECTVAADPSVCSFKPVKAILQESEI